MSEASNQVLCLEVLESLWQLIHLEGSSNCLNEWVVHHGNAPYSSAFSAKQICNQKRPYQCLNINHIDLPSVGVFMFQKFLKGSHFESFEDPQDILCVAETLEHVNKITN
jgi:hypothetical protein